MSRHELIMLAGIGVAFWLGWRQLELQRQILELQRTQAAPAIDPAFGDPWVSMGGILTQYSSLGHGPFGA
jgi:hypothetical protein